MIPNGSAAPVCPISRSQAAPGMPGIRVPMVPKATDLPSAIQAANTIKNILQQILANQKPVINNIGQPSPPLGPSGGSSPTSQGSGRTPSAKRSDWKETSRRTEIWRFFNEHDEDIWIEVERLTKVVWTDKGRKTTLTFEYGEGSLDKQMSSGPFPYPLAKRMGPPDSTVDWKNYPFGLAATEQVVSQR
jgi:hypothetical protein